MVSIFMFQKIRRLRDQGKKNREIARELKIDRKTVAKYLKQNGPPQFEERSYRTREDSFGPFEDRAKVLLQTCEKITATEVYEIIKDEGYKGSERTVRRRVGEWKRELPKERFFEQVYEAGEQAQFDFKECVELPFADGLRSLYLHFGTLPFSDAFSIKAYPFKNYECFMDGVHSFFEKMGGITRNIRFDNLSPCVVKVLKGAERVYTKAFEQAIEYYGFGTLPCSPGKGNEKGDVEREIRTHSSRIKNLVRHQGIVFKDYEHLNEWLDDYREKRHSEKQREKLNEEKKSLLPLPGKNEEVLCKVEISVGSAYGTVRVGKSVYSIPDFMIRQGLRVVAGPYEVRIYRLGSSKECLATHPRKRDGEESILLEHVLPSLIRKPQAMVRWAHRDILFPTPSFKEFYHFLRRLDSLNAEREFLRSINLVQHLSLEDIGLGMDLVREAKGHEPFCDLKELLLGEREACNVIEISQRLNQRPLNPNLSSYDNLIPKKGE